MGMTDLCDPLGDSAQAGRRISEPIIRSPNLIYLRFSVKQANGFIYELGPVCFKKRLVFLFENITNIYNLWNLFITLCLQDWVHS